MAVSYTVCGLGIPTVTADTAEELMFGQGQVTARTRAWQLLVETWRVRGEAGRHLGAEHHALDDLVTQVDLDGIAQRCFRRAPAPARKMAAAYARGVNSALRDALRADETVASAPFLSALGFDDPGALAAAAPAWRPWTPCAVMLLAHLLFGAYPETLWREHARRCLGDEAALLLQADPVASAGSNAWLVPGHLVDDGVTRLFADPHRLLECPGPYQQIRLRAPGITVDGLAFPGFPGTPHFGQTASVAWVITHAMADAQPLVRCPAPDSGFPLIGADVDGPLGLAWSAARHGDGGLSTSLALLSARTTTDVHEAFATWTDPVDDVLCADVAGDAMSFVAGRVPTLTPQQRLGATHEVETLRGDGPWEPRALRHCGKAAVLVNANEHKPGEPRLGFTYCASARSRRIDELIHEVSRDGPGAPERFAAIAMDTRDEECHRMIRELLGPHVEGLSARAREHRDRLLRWGGHFEASDPEAAVVSAFRDALVQHLAGHPTLVPLGRPTGLPPLYRPWTDPVTRIGLALWRILRHAPVFGIDTVAACRVALESMEPPASTGGPQTWGEIHTAAPLVTLPSSLPHPERYAPEPIPTGGDTECVLSTGSLPGVTATCLRAPVARVQFAVGRPELSHWVVPWGADGRPHSPHHDDQSALWQTGASVPIRTAPALAPPANRRPHRPEETSRA